MTTQEKNFIEKGGNNIFKYGFYNKLQKEN